MGILLWLLAAIAVFIASRTVAAARPPDPWAELLLALLAGLGAGLTATALDFGGWGEPDWRAAAFAALCSTTLIGLRRLTGPRHPR